MTALKDWVAFGLRCRVLMGPVGAMNGYVAVPKSHPAYDVNYDKLDISVHGGLTFGSRGGVTNDPKWIDKEKNYPDSEVYWFGFDTSHSGDWVNYHEGGHKWTLDEVVAETESMAKQFSEMKFKVFLDYSAKYDIEKFYGKEFLYKLLLGEADCNSTSKQNQEADEK